MANSTAPDATPIQAPVRNPNNVEAKKFYIFNETGNIMMASTVDTSAPISESVQKVFAEVSVFFAAMSRAITTTPNPDDGGKPYSLYNYNALERIISGSGIFVHVTEEDVLYTSSSWGVTFSKDLLEALLGLATGAGAMGFASAMMASIGKEGLRIGGSSSHSESKVANIVFVCEYLLGMPIVSAIVVYADMTKNQQQVSVGPCFHEQTQSLHWQLHKDTYLFVAPEFIHTYAGDLDSVNTDPQYLELISWLSRLVSQTSSILSVEDTSDSSTVASETALETTKTYALLGQFLGSAGKLKFAGEGSAGVITSGTWGPNSIQFTVSGTQGTAASIIVTDTAGTKIVTQTSQQFSIKA